MGAAARAAASGDPMNAPSGCSPSDLYGGDVVTCATPNAIRVELGAGDDDADMSDGLPVPVTIDGGAGDDWLNAADEAAVLDGGAGEDKLVGGVGDDVLRGGDGNDTIEARDGEVDSITCGAGADTVDADPQDIVARDCENVVRGAAGSSAGQAGSGSAKGAAGKVALKGRTRLAKALRKGFTVRVSGVKAGRRVKLTASRAGKVVARGSATARTTTVTVKLRFTAAGRKGAQGQAQGDAGRARRGRPRRYHAAPVGPGAPRPLQRGSSRKSLT
jgi:Ca2+-binding RTX toxin-like protein